MKLVASPRTPLLLLCLGAFLSLHAQFFPLIRHLGTEQGLSQGHVNVLFKDSRGFLWAGTQDGLNRYDGHGFRSYFHEDGNPRSLAGNFVQALTEDAAGNLWIGTFNGGLCRFDRRREIFQTYLPSDGFQAPANLAVRALAWLNHDTLAVGTDKGLLLFLPKVRRFVSLARLDSSLLQIGEVNALLPLEEGALLMGTSAGLFVRFSDGRLERISTPGLSTVLALAMQEGEVFVGGLSGLHRFRRQDRTKGLEYLDSHFPRPQTDSNRLANAVNALQFDEEGRLWVGTLEGLYYYRRQPSASHWEPFEPQTGNAHTLADTYVQDLLLVQPGLMWAATRQGIDGFSTRPPVFHTLHSPEGQALGCSDVIFGMAQDSRGNLWLGTREGLTRIGPRSWNRPSSLEVECLNPANTPSMPHDYVINVVFQADELWVTFWRHGVARLSATPEGRWQFHPIPGLASLTQSSGIHDLWREGRDLLWLATPNRGLVRYEFSRNRFEVLAPDDSAAPISSPYVFYLLQDSQQRFWAGTATGGLCRLEADRKSFTCFTHDPADPASLSSNMVLSLFEDSRRRLWVCTAQGLNLWLGQGRFRRFYRKDGLPNDVVYGLLEDDTGRLWASTNGGLSMIQYEEGAFRCQSFTHEDGLPGNEFNQYAFYKAENGLLLFGGPNGLTFFNPADIRPYPHPPGLALTAFELFNQPVPVGGQEKKSSLPAPIDELSTLELKHYQNHLSFEFAALSYLQPENCRYAYMLEGLDPAWVYTERRHISYPNLSPGRYTLKIKAANHDDIWMEQPRTLRITILPPWWATPWAWAFYAATLLGGAVWFVRWREGTVRREERIREAERESFRKRSARDFHDEAGNKITKIALLTGVAQSRTRDPHLQPLLQEIAAHVEELRNGMRDFIWVLDPSQDNLYNSLLRIRDFANHFFENSSITFQMEGLHPRMERVALSAHHRRQLLLLVKEALTNCLRHSEAANAHLKVHLKEGLVHLLFHDDGKGFDPRQASHGQGMKNMFARAKIIGAQLQVHSLPGQGTTLELTWKITQKGEPLPAP